MPIKAIWRPFTLETIDLAPKEAGVYELGYKSNSLVVYIGSSKTSIRSRLLWHTQRKAFDGITHFRFRKTDSDTATKAERKLCIEYAKKHGKKPKLNKNIPPNDDPFRGLFMP